MMSMTRTIFSWLFDEWTAHIFAVDFFPFSTVYISSRLLSCTYIDSAHIRIKLYMIISHKLCCLGLSLNTTSLQMWQLD